jgi:hypothetical protein
MEVKYSFETTVEFQHNTRHYNAEPELFICAPDFNLNKTGLVFVVETLSVFSEVWLELLTLFI